ncbi:hypothetical protein RZS28_10185 [Methylocapsa polymorpha]|uniref:PNPLA domain-containing protein n=1 Tax=Methylocapsa polymorpha TaxID=3080828 RepID=A0ABZ0HNL3_9HYPH|nr:hypothetical protein RZS28_10185 [Methylocapsa sp. RX1]
MQTLSREEFQIGLTMSGAISAGAYTAGVFDFLIQALDEWEKARNGAYRETGVDPEQIPNHRVGLKVMSGASAGAITAAIGAVALADANQKPVPFNSPGGSKQQFKCFLPKLYDTWVARPGLVAEDGQTSDFLQAGDLDKRPDPADDFSSTSDPAPAADGPLPVTSALNSRLLDGIAKAAIDVTAVTSAPRAYISERLHIYLTLSNLRGVPYTVPFTGGAFGMVSHGDRVHYAVTGVGSWPRVSDFGEADKKREIDVATLVKGDPNNKEWKDFAICAVASAAFPIGLAPREIDGARAEFVSRHFPIEAIAEFGSMPDWPIDVWQADSFRFTTADGGIIDNDPFEYARLSLKDPGATQNERGLAEADRAVIMISPFPKAPSIKPEGQPKFDIVSIFRALQPALIEQARFKPSELVLAADPKIGSRYLIGPSRPPADDGRPEAKERYPIASGLLGGFGGFVARAFRDHDFQLGRRNCQRFLSHIFTVPPDHAIYKAWPKAAQQNPDFRADPTETLQEAYCIIPLFGSARDEVVLPEWPRISDEFYKTLQKRIADRFDYVAPALLEQNVKGILWALLRIAIIRPVGVIRGRTLEFAERTIRCDLVRRNQIEGWRDLPKDTGLDDDEIRLVLAELIDPAYDQRNVRGLVKATGLKAEKIEALLAACQSAKSGKHKVWKAWWTDKTGKPLYALASLKPNPIKSVGYIIGVGIAKYLPSFRSIASTPRIDPPEF